MEKQIRIAMIGWEFPPVKVGGLAVHTYNLVKELAERGIKIDLFLPNVGITYTVPHENVRIIEVTDCELYVYFNNPLVVKKGNEKFRNLYPSNIINILERYTHLCAKLVSIYHSIFRYDLVHGHDWITVPTCNMIKFSLNIPWVHTFHSTEYDRNTFPWDYICDIERLGVQNADKLIAVSRRMRELLIEKYSANSNKIVVIYNGINFEDFMNVSNDTKKTLLRDDLALHLKDKKIVLFIGRLTPQKGPEYFLEVAKKVLEHRKDVVFVIGGKGELLPKLINIAISSNIINNVIFLGYVKEEHLASIYALADVFVMPSSSEPFGIAVLEAIAAGTPVIISKTSGVAEVIKTAFKVDFWDTDKIADTILGILKYPVVKKVMYNLQIDEVKKFSWDKVADETKQVYIRALNNE
ncbi:MAG: glycosyltransferase family 4 protein [Candidatus Anstonellales archaeon]